MRVLKFQTDDGSMHAVDLTQVHRIIQDQFGVIFLSGASFHLSTPYKSFEQVLDQWHGCDEQGKPVETSSMVGTYATREAAAAGMEAYLQDQIAKHPPPRAAFDESWERQTQAAEKPKWPENWRQVPYEGGENPIKPNCPGCGAAWLTHHADTCPIAQGVNSGVVAAIKSDEMEQHLSVMKKLAQMDTRISVTLDTILARLATIQPNGGNAPGPLYTRQERNQAIADEIEDLADTLGTYAHSAKWVEIVRRRADAVRQSHK
jgi:hypothetical protein